VVPCSAILRDLVFEANPRRLREVNQQPTKKQQQRPITKVRTVGCASACRRLPVSQLAIRGYGGDGRKAKARCEPNDDVEQGSVLVAITCLDYWNEILLNNLQPSQFSSHIASIVVVAQAAYQFAHCL